MAVGDEEAVRRDECDRAAAHAREQRERTLGWHATLVSWGQFMVALAVLIFGFVLDRIATENRVSVLEARQQSSQKTSENVDARLAIIQGQLNDVLVAMARYEARQQKVQEDVQQQREMNGSGTRR